MHRYPTCAVQMEPRQARACGDFGDLASKVADLRCNQSSAYSWK